MSENLVFSKSKTEVTLNYRQTLYKFDQFEQCWIPRWWIFGTWFHYLQKSSVTSKVILILVIPQNTKNHIDPRLIYAQVSYSGYLSQKQNLPRNSNSLHTLYLSFTSTLLNIMKLLCVVPPHLPVTWNLSILHWLH